MPLTRDQAQQRADDIQAFYREVERLQAEQVLDLGSEKRQELQQHHRQLLDTYRLQFDIDANAQSKRLSLGMRMVSLLGALALAASLLFFFYQFWGLFREGAQVAILVGFSVGSLLLTFFIRRHDPSGYFSKLAALLAFACFVLNISLLGQIFNITPSDQALLPWAAFALLLAYQCNARLLLIAGLLCLVAYSGTRLSAWSGLIWLQAGERPENFLLAGLLLFLWPHIISQARFSGFAATYRLIGLFALFTPMLVLACGFDGSYLPLAPALIEQGYQLAGFALAALMIWQGNRREWTEVALSGQVMFITFMAIKMADWWWALLPKYLFFLILGLAALATLLLLARLRRQGGART